MFFSIRIRILLCCIILVVLTATSLMWFAHQDTIATLRANARNSLNNIMSLLERDLGVSHTDNLRGKLADVRQIKNDLRIAAKMALMQIQNLGLAQIPLAHYPAHMEEFIASEEMFEQKNISLAFFHQENKGDWTDMQSGQPLPDLPRQQLPLLGQPEDAIFISSAASANELFLVQKLDSIILLARTTLAQVETRSPEAMGQNILRFQTLIEDVRIQQSGFAMALDKKLAIVAGSRNATVSPQLKKVLQTDAFLGAQRRLIILPTNLGGTSEMLYLVSYFRPFSWHLVVAAPIDEMEATVFAIVGRQLEISAVIMLLGIVAGLILASRITGPLRRLTQVVKTFPEQNLMDIDPPRLAASLPGKRRDEIGELARSFGFMAEELHSNILQLVEVTAQTERLAGELRVARDIQYGILPEPLDSRPELEIHASMVTAKEVGGDLYDFFFVDEHTLCFVIGDVAGKGVPAALFMSMVVTTIRSACEDGREVAPERVLAQINNILARRNPENMFVTLCMGLLDVRDGTLRWTSAGHFPPVRMGVDGAGSLPPSGDTMAGIFADLQYHIQNDVLLPGESVVLYTDGVSEAFNEAEEMFGDERVCAELKPLYGQDAEQIGSGLLAAVRDFSGQAGQSDDIAIMVIRYLGPEA